MQQKMCQWELILSYKLILRLEKTHKYTIKCTWTVFNNSLEKKIINLFFKALIKSVKHNGF